MTVRGVTFDCAQTLVDVDWRPAVVAVECAAEAGLAIDEVTAAAAYDELLRKKWCEFKLLNLTRDERTVDNFWRELTVAWVNQMGLDPACVDPLLGIAERRIFGSGSTVFRVYDDVVPTLNLLRTAGFKLGVVSNWDISLHKTLRAFDLSGFFDVVVASMEEGCEKPDTRLFQIAVERLGLRPDEVLHVGDNPVDDYLGAKRAGLRSLVIDRSAGEPSPAYLTSLEQLPGRVGLEA